MTRYSAAVSKRVTPQTEKADPKQIKNNQSGFVFEVNDWNRLERFLVIGSENGSFYAGERKLTRENAAVVERCLVEDGPRTVAVIAEVSDSGRAPKNDPAIFALALACCADSLETRQAAFRAIGTVCRIGTHLFQFVQDLKELRSIGAGLRNAIGNWYGSRDPEQLAFQICKYAQRNGMSHRDVFRLAHPKAPSAEHEALYRYIVTGYGGTTGSERTVSNKKTGAIREYESVGSLPPFIDAFQQLKTANEKDTISLIREYGFTHEMIDTSHKNSASVWEALLEKMPLHAMVRNLGKMSQVGLLKPLSQASKLVAERLNDYDRIHKSRLHPVALLSAQKIYAQGHGDKGSLTWSVVPQVVDALESGFYKSFEAIEPSGRNALLALDCSASMTWATSVIPSLKITAREASACLAMVTARSEPNYHIIGFCNYTQELPITKHMSLPDVIRVIERTQAAGTDCAAPMLYAAGHNLDVDVFAVYTDNETAHGHIHPHQALKAYRNKQGKPNAGLVTVGCVSNGFTIADPKDPRQLDVIGFDTTTPAVISDFMRG